MEFSLVLSLVFNCFRHRLQFRLSIWGALIVGVSRYIARVPLRPPPLPHRTLYTKFTYWISNIASGWYQDKWEFRCQFAFVQFSSKWHFSARIRFILRAITVSYYLSTCDLPVCVCMSVSAFLTTPLLVLRFSRCEFLSLLYANDMRTFFSSLVLSSLYFFGLVRFWSSLLRYVGNCCCVTLYPACWAYLKWV